MRVENLKICAESFPIKSCGTGDLIAMFYALENLGFQKSIKFNIFLKDFDISFYDSFEFKNIILCDEEQGRDFIQLISDFSINHFCCNNLGYFNGSFFIVSMINFLKREYHYRPQISKSIALKKFCDKKIGTAVQFDSRSANKKRLIEKFIINRILQKQENWFCIGGKDTKRYLKDAEYFLGDFKFIIDKLQKSKKFIGSDSGLSHLSCCIGIESYIYIKDFCGCIEKYYKESYRNCKIFNIKKIF